MAKEISISFALNAAIGAGFKGAFQSASAAVSNVGAAIRNMERTPVGNLGQAMERQRGKIKGLAADLKEARNTLAALQAQQRNGATAMLTRQIALAEDRVNSLTGAMQRQLGAWKNTAAQAATTAGSVRALSADYQRLSQDMDRARKAQGALNANRAQAAALQSQRANLQGRLAGAMGAAAAVAIPAKLSIDFEQAIANVGAVSNATDEDLKRLTDTARQLGRDTMFSASEAAEGMKYLAMAGFNTEKTIAAMPGLLDLAAASATDLGRTSDIASDILTAFNLKASDMDEVGNILTRTFTNSNTDLAMLGETMKYVGPVAASLGMTLDQTSAYAGALANAGIKASQGGTVLRAAMLRLAAPPKASRDTLGQLTGLEGEELDRMQEELGSGAEQLAKLGMTTKDSAGNLRPMVDILEELNMRTAKMGTAEKAAVFKNVFGAEASAGMIALAEQAAKTVDDAGNQIVDSTGKQTTALRKLLETTTLEQITASNVAKKQADTTQGSLKLLSSAWQDVGITIGNFFLPVIRGAAGAFSGVAGVISNFTEIFPGLSKVVALSVGGILAFTAASVGIGLVLNFVRAGINGFRGGLLRVGAAHAATAASTTVNTVATMKFGAASRVAGNGAKFFAGGLRSILIATGAGAALVALGFAVNLLIDNWDAVSTVIAGAWANIEDTWSRCAVFFTVLGQNLAQIFAGAWNRITGVFAWARDFAIDCWNSAVGFFTDLWNGIVSSATGAWNGITGIFFWAYNQVLGLWEGVTGFFEDVGNSVSGSLSGIWQPVVDWAMWAWENISAIWNAAGAFFEGVVNAISAPFNWLFNWLKDKFQWVIDTVSWIGSVVDSITGAVSDAKKEAFDAYGKGDAAVAANYQERAKKSLPAAGGAPNPQPPETAKPARQPSKFTPVEAPAQAEKKGGGKKAGGAGRSKGGGGAKGASSASSGASAASGSGPVTVVTLDSGNQIRTQFFPASQKNPGQQAAASTPGATGAAKIQPVGVMQTPLSGGTSAQKPVMPQASAALSKRQATKQQQAQKSSSISIDLTQNFDLITQDASAARKILEAIRPDMEALIRKALEKISSDRRRTAYAQ